MYVLTGTAIWETAKTNNGGPTPTDKSTWNQKVAGNNDPNVWNGEGSKDKDNALWDNLPSTKEPDTPGLVHIAFYSDFSGIVFHVET